jgi:hypothetical protein
MKMGQAPNFQNIHFIVSKSDLCMSLFLHAPKSPNNLSREYHKAFSNAEELFVVSAYLTDWDSTLKLGKNCKHFRIIVGKDFGITRKHACREVMKWLTAPQAAQFKVADNISGFHPKAIFWRESSHKYYVLLGSSNLTRAAFQTNYEANIVSEISEDEYLIAKSWIKMIEKDSIVVSNDWLDSYVEGGPPKISKGKSTAAISEKPIVSIKLPNPEGMMEIIRRRRAQLRKHMRHKEDLLNLFRQCANGTLSSPDFYYQLPLHWSTNIDNRLQGFGWEILGKNSNFQSLSLSFIRIIDSLEDDRDDIVQEEIDRLAKLKVSTRSAFLSEMLCLAFPGEFPILNDPVKKYLRSIKFRGPRGATEGASYIETATKLRYSLRQNIKYPAKDLAELDAVIWQVFG